MVKGIFGYLRSELKSQPAHSCGRICLRMPQIVNWLHVCELHPSVEEPITASTLASSPY
jgi:hypothetical protein